MKCPACKSENLRYFEHREHSFEVQGDAELEPVQDALLMEDEPGYMMQVECQDCYLTSDENLELAKIRDKIVKKNDRLNV